MKYIGIDYGTKRIGVAVSDDTGTVAFPLASIEADREALSKIVALMEEQKAEIIILGESRNFKGEPNDVMEDIEQFKKDIEELTKLPVTYQAEFMTTALATREGETKADKLDASAAALILQSYLDTIKNHGGPH
ncbi:MAG TPA: Holliday junction resolvase RuvX [Candidatus Paceibacterota bacterium]|nr:Holliday junction resolvase RuvX [Candidatus Paceibacterota bacterium]